MRLPTYPPSGSKQPDGMPHCGAELAGTGSRANNSACCTTVTPGNHVVREGLARTAPSHCTPGSLLLQVPPPQGRLLQPALAQGLRQRVYKGGTALYPHLTTHSRTPFASVTALETCRNRTATRTTLRYKPWPLFYRFLRPLPLPLSYDVAPHPRMQHFCATPALANSAILVNTCSQPL